MYKYLFFFYLLLFLSCKGDSNAIDSAAYEEHKQNLADLETTKPLAFIHVKAEHSKNWIGQTVVKGTVSNNATVSSYKRVRLKMLCFDKNNKMVEEHEDILDTVLKPGNHKDFKLRYRLPRGTDSIKVSIMNAEVVN